MPLLTVAVLFFLRSTSFGEVLRIQSRFAIIQSTHFSPSIINIKTFIFFPTSSRHAPPASVCAAAIGTSHFFQSCCLIEISAARACWMFSNLNRLSLTIPLKRLCGPRRLRYTTGKAAFNPRRLPRQESRCLRRGSFPSRAAAPCCLSWSHTGTN